MAGYTVMFPLLALGAELAEGVGLAEGAGLAMGTGLAAGAALISELMTGSEGSRGSVDAAEGTLYWIAPSVSLGETKISIPVLIMSSCI